MGYRTDKFLSFILCWIEKMAARAGIEPGQPIWPSSATTIPIGACISQDERRSIKNRIPSDQLFTAYTPVGIADSVSYEIFAFRLIGFHFRENTKYPTPMRKVIKESHFMRSIRLARRSDIKSTRASSASVAARFTSTAVGPSSRARA